VKSLFEARLLPVRQELPLDRFAFSTAFHDGGARLVCIGCDIHPHEDAFTTILLVFQADVCVTAGGTVRDVLQLGRVVLVSLVLFPTPLLLLANCGMGTPACGQRTFSAAGAFPGRCPWSPRWEVRLRNRCVEQLIVWQIYRGRTDDENIARDAVSGDWSWTRGFAHCKSTGRREHFLGRRKTVAYHPDLPLLVASMGMNGEKLVDFRIAVCRTYRVPSRTIGSRGLRFTKWALNASHVCIGLGREIACRKPALGVSSDALVGPLMKRNVGFHWQDTTLFSVP